VHRSGLGPLLRRPLSAHVCELNQREGCGASAAPFPRPPRVAGHAALAPMLSLIKPGPGMATSASRPRFRPSWPRPRPRLTQVETQRASSWTSPSSLFFFFRPLLVQGKPDWMRPGRARRGRGPNNERARPIVACTHPIVALARRDGNFFLTECVSCTPTPTLHRSMMTQVAAASTLFLASSGWAFPWTLLSASGPQCWFPSGRDRAAGRRRSWPRSRTSRGPGSRNQNRTAAYLFFWKLIFWQDCQIVT